MWIPPIIWQCKIPDEERTRNWEHQNITWEEGTALFVFHLHCPSSCKPTAFLGLWLWSLNTAHWKWSPELVPFSPGLSYPSARGFITLWAELSEFFHFLHHLPKVAHGDNFPCQQLIWSEIMLLNFLHKSALFSTAFFNDSNPMPSPERCNSLLPNILHQESQICSFEACFLSRDIMKL